MRKYLYENTITLYQIINSVFLCFTLFFSVFFVSSRYFYTLKVS